MMSSGRPPELPNLFIVGAPKCGTTAWVEYLGTHPDIFFPEHKDQCFFAYDLPNFRLIRTAEDYAAQFVQRGDAAVVGEASAMYLFSTAAADAIHAHNPASKILIFLREQEDYLPSLHNQFLREFAEEIDDFETAWKLSGKRPPETIPTTCLEPRTLDYAAMGDFRRQVERYLSSFPKEQILVIQFRDWTAYPRVTYLKILQFLGIPDDGRSDFPLVNPGQTYRSRRLARLIMRPPALLRPIARWAKRFGVGRWIYRAARSAGFRSSPGYDREIPADLREQIRRHYAKDNQRLAERVGLKHQIRTASTQSKR